MGTQYRGAKLDPQADLAAITALMDEIDNRCHHRSSFPLPQTEPASTMQLQSQPKRTFTQAADDYIEQYRSNREYDGSLRGSSYDKTKRAVAFWKYYFKGVRLDEIDITVCRRAERDCRNYPKNIDSDKAAPMCRENHGLKTTGVQATKTRLKSLRNIFAHALKHQWIPSDPTSIIDTRQRRGSSDTDKEPFTIEKLQAIFPGSDYGIDFFPRQATRVRQYDATKFWIPLIAAFIGARLGEIIQLELNDTKQDDSATWHFHITTESDNEDSGKELKTVSSRRRVPVHPQLIEIGLMDFVKERQQHSSKPTGLFDHYCLPPRPKGAKITT